VNNTVRQTGSVLGIAAGGTVMSIVYRHAAAATGRPELSTAADRPVRPPRGGPPVSLPGS